MNGSNSRARWTEADYCTVTVAKRKTLFDDRPVEISVRCGEPPRTSERAR